MCTQGLLTGLFLTLFALEPATLLSDRQVLRQAETAYRHGLHSWSTPMKSQAAFARAATYYEELRRRGISNSVLDRNLARAYLLARKLPQVILTCRRGLRLDRHDADLQNLLEEARGQVEYSTYGAFARPPVDHWPPWLPRLTARLRLLLVMVGYVLACAAVTRWWMTRRGSYLGLASFTLALTLPLGVGLIQESRERAWEQAHPLVLITHKSALHKGDSTRYPCYDAVNKSWLDVADAVPPAATPLFPGVEAHLHFARGDWLQIELSGGEIGWVRKQDTLVDTP